MTPVLLQHIWGPRMLLELNGIHAFYGKIEALKGLSLRVREHTIVSLLGANGAGKTTTVRTIVGLHRSRDNDIRFDDRPIGNVPPHQMVGLGISMVPERRELFPDMSVADNLEMGAYRRRDRQDIRRTLDWIHSLFPVLTERRGERAGALSGGQQQMLAIGRGLMSRPRLLLLDEPTLGLAPLLVNQIFAIVQELNNQGITILLIEQNARQALKLAEYGYILENGRIVLEGESALLMEHEDVRRSYLGAI
jgi:branched-chain amino acid transport system ATP-binding protein